MFSNLLPLLINPENPKSVRFGWVVVLIWIWLILKYIESYLFNVFFPFFEFLTNSINFIAKFF